MGTYLGTQFVTLVFQRNVCFILFLFRDLDEALEMGMDWSLREGYVWAEDKVTYQ